MAFGGVEQEIVEQAADRKGHHDAAREKRLFGGKRARAQVARAHERGEQQQPADAELHAQMEVLVMRMPVPPIVQERRIALGRLIERFDPAAGAGTRQRVLNWTAIFDEIHDFELNTRGVAGGVGAIVHTVSNPPANSDRIDFVGAGGVPNPDNGFNVGSVKGVNDSGGTVDGVAVGPGQLADWDEILAYVKTIRSPRGRTELTGDPVAGRALFDQANCEFCHGGPLWTLSEMYYVPQADADLRTELFGANGISSIGDPIRLAMGTRFDQEVYDALRGPDEASCEWLQETLSELLGEFPTRVMDPACGPGSWLVPFAVALHYELQDYVAAGLTPLAAIRTATIEGRPITVEEAAGVLQVLILGGHDTTVHAMGNIFTAYKNRTPLVITAGQQARSILPYEPFLFAAQATELPKPAAHAMPPTPLCSP